MAGCFETHFAGDHPAGPGHFPGNPIIPGALLLDTVLYTIAGDKIGRGCEIRSVKFMIPVRPGDTIRIEWHEEHGLTRFQCQLLKSGAIAMLGTLRLSDRTE